ncbi:hypothetical protein EYF80_029934 [Liparis tanakae]|uniref:Uncharacterized protein n=1 Tax=Liparis tanakae TaxID=230148 RepID=A0A4Z2H3L4_9TELE|nr:hypothetical protein EYF80_029934 [Liparis tanakae]
MVLKKFGYWSLSLRQGQTLESLLNYTWRCVLQPVTVLSGEPMVVGYSYLRYGTPASHLVAALYCD